MMTYKDRIDYIANECAKHNVPHSTNEIWEGWQIRFPWCDGDVAAHDGTYGAKQGMVESYEFPWDDGDVTVLTPEEAALRICTLYDEYRQKEEDDAWRAIGF